MKAHPLTPQRATALLLCCSALLVCSAPAQTVTWQRKAAGQPRTDPCGQPFNFPNNNNWSQQRQIGNACNQDFVSQPSNWSTLMYPNSSTVNVMIPASQPVRLDIGGLTVGTLQLGSGASLFMDRASLTIAGTGNALVNNGTITAQNNYGGAFLTFTHNSSITGTGDIVLVESTGSDGGAGIATSSGATLTLGANQTIHGTGEIDADLINNGLVVSDSNAGGNLTTLQIHGTNVSNNGTLKTIQDHTLLLNRTNVTQSDSGQVLTNGGGIECDGATITGGTLNAANGGYFVGNGVTLNDVTNNAALSVGQYAVNGSLLNRATISILGNPYLGALIAQSNTTISGPGRITMTQGGYSAIQSAAGAKLTLAGGQTIDGGGTISAALVNNGSIISTLGSIILNGADKLNNGTIRTTKDKDVEIIGTTLHQGQTGRIIADGSIIILNSANDKAGVISGGILSSTNGGYFGGAGTMHNVTNNGAIGIGYLAITGGSLVNNGNIAFGGNPNVGTLEFRADTLVTGTGTIASTQGGYSLMKIDPGFTLTNGKGHTISGNGNIQGKIVNRGIVVPTANQNLQFQATGSTALTNNGGSVRAPANSTLNFEAGVPFVQTAGVISLQGGVINAPSGLDLKGGRLIGNGTFNAAVRNPGGRVAPGFSPGSITINGNYNQGANGVLSMEIGGAADTTKNDRLTVNGAATLGGMLELRLRNGFTPAASAEFTIVASQSMINGGFSNVPNGTRLQTNDGAGSFIVTYRVLDNAALSQNVTLSNFKPAPTGNDADPAADESTGEAAKDSGDEPVDGELSES